MIKSWQENFKLDINMDNSEIIYEQIKEYILDFDCFSSYTIKQYDYCKLFINGDWLGFLDKPKELLDYFKYLRKNGNIHPHCSIYWNIQEYSMYIYSDSGRLTRPLIEVSNNMDISLTSNKWDEIILNEKFPIQYIDFHEVNNSLIAINHKQITVNHTHSEIHPCLLLGTMASCIPFSNHNQSPRNTYQSAMGKQALGIHCTNYLQRFDTFSHILYYPQKPFVNTRIMNHIQYNNLPSGINCIVAIATYGGYNQEDSVLINKAALDRGLFNSTFYRTYKEEEKKNQLTGDEDKFCKPNTQKLLHPKPCNYNKLGDKGFIKEDTQVSSNDIIIGKVIPIKNNPDYLYKDQSTYIRPNESGYIDENYVSINSEGYRFCKVRVRTIKKPDIGDKVSSRHGQKGTIGMIYNQEDMPYSESGIVPDIIMNPHAVPSRMTIAQLIECILGKTCSELGYMGDGTPFNETNINDIITILESCGYEGCGNETLYSGINGDQLKTQIFMGPTFYQRLKHMSGDKIHSRSSGPIVSMTRQPAEGRSAHGGLRFGEMERDCMISHGSAAFLKERFMEVSDKYTIYICNLCNCIACGNPHKSIYECKKCNNYEDFTKCYIPYSCKLLLQELMTMSISPRLLTN